MKPPAPTNAVTPFAAAIAAEIEPLLRRIVREEMADLKVRKHLMTAREAAAYVRIRAARFAEIAEAGDVPHVVIEGRRKFLRPDLDDWAARQHAA